MKIESEYIRFIHYTSGNSGYPESKIEITIGADSTLSEVIEKFESFLKASGYIFNGTLDIVEDEQHELEKEDF